jgi:hypothetical protein
MAAEAEEISKNMANPASPVHAARVRVEPGWSGAFEVLAAWFLPGRLELLSGTESNLFRSDSEARESKRQKQEQPNLFDSTSQVRR